MRFWLVFLAMVSACDFPRPADVSDDAASSGGGDFTLSATPMALDVPIAGSAVAALAISRVGNVGAVTLSAPNLPAGVTVAFATDSVPPGTNSSDVTVSVAAGTPVGTSSVTIVGSDGGHEKSVTLAVTVRTLTVAGMVRGGIAGVTVRVVGKPAVLSGPNGTFTFTDVTPPYDIYTVGTTGNSAPFVPTVFYVQGVTRPDPIVNAPMPPVIRDSSSNGTTISGTKTGSDANPLVVAWDSGGFTFSTTGSYSFGARWSPATDTRTGILYGFQYSKKANGAPDVFTGYGESGPVTLTGMVGGVAPVPATINLSLTPPQTAALTGEITAPPGFSLPLLALSQQTGRTGNGITLWQSLASTLDATIPLVSSGTSSLLALSTSSGNDVTGFIYPGLHTPTDVTLALPAPAVQLSPIAAATGITRATTFTWSASSMTIYQVTFSTTPTKGTSKVIYQITTTSASTTLPIVPELPLPNSQSFDWFVQGVAPHGSIDDAVSSRDIGSAPVPTFDGSFYTFTASHSIGFTTATTP